MARLKLLDIKLRECRSVSNCDFCAAMWLARKI